MYLLLIFNCKSYSSIVRQISGIELKNFMEIQGAQIFTINPIIIEYFDQNLLAVIESFWNSDPIFLFRFP